jgi:sarcosine/dimethylglycine N-methyltransferase
VHYARIAEELNARRHELTSSDAFIDRMLTGLRHWVGGAREGLLAWGILHFRKAT